MAPQTPIPPTAIALVVCDNVYRESGGKHALVGVFNRIIARDFPVVHPKLCVFVSITSIRPNTQCSLDIVHGETDDAVIAMKGPAPEGIGPTAVWDVVFEMQPMVFTKPGTYYVRFIGNGQVLMQRPFEVMQMSSGKAEEADDHSD